MVYLVDVREVFYTFMKSTFCTENLKFWIEVDEFKSIDPQNVDLIKQRAKIIFDKYFGNAEEVNVSALARANLWKNMDNPQLTVFDECQKQIFDLMRMDSLPKFRRTQSYKDAKGNSTCTESTIYYRIILQLDSK